VCDVYGVSLSDYRMFTVCKDYTGESSGYRRLPLGVYWGNLTERESESGNCVTHISR
jgi:hypothetical protein